MGVGFVVVAKKDNSNPFSFVKRYRALTTTSPTYKNGTKIFGDSHEINLSNREKKLIPKVLCGKQIMIKTNLGNPPLHLLKDM